MNDLKTNNSNKKLNELNIAIVLNGLNKYVLI